MSKNLLTTLVILFFVVSVGFFAYTINQNLAIRSEIQQSLVTSEAAKGGTLC